MLPLSGGKVELFFSCVLCYSGEMMFFNCSKLTVFSLIQVCLLLKGNTDLWTFNDKKKVINLKISGPVFTLVIVGECVKIWLKPKDF